MTAQGFATFSWDKRGFTLVEVLISIAMLALIATIALPNFRRFNEDQTLKNTTANLISSLKTAQNNAQTGVKCPDGVSTPQSWSVIITGTASSLSYYLQESCLNLTTGVASLNNLPLVSVPPTVISSPAALSCTITYTQTMVSPASSCYSVTLNDTGTSPPKRQILIDKGGAITCQQQNADGSVAANPC